ncbi:cysteine dioxygenase family protein [Streptomyces sp. NPDC093510]|uniref:cysteine dioxygenase family protein n=1 Tax=Streptomyces sp. NPDC093510 TaxID=3155199 RepID=UPI00341D82C9
MSPVSERTAEMVEALRSRIGGTRSAAGADGPEPWQEAEDVLASFLGHSDLLTPEQWEADPQSYRQHLLHADPDDGFSVVALVWLPGQRTPVHDHVAWCVVGVHHGEEEEEHFRICDDEQGTHLVLVARSVNPEGSVTSVQPPGDIHLVHNRTEGKVISVHIYGADLTARGSSIRRCYDMPIRSAHP